VITVNVIVLELVAAEVIAASTAETTSFGNTYAFSITLDVPSLRARASSPGRR
jgi:hypothetical protein